MAILILGDPSDPHVAGVVRCVEEFGIAYFVFHRFCLEHQICLAYDGKALTTDFRIGERLFRDTEIEAVWSRVKPIALAAEPGSEQWLGQEFAAKEWGSVIQSLAMLLEHAKWVNNQQAQQKIANKPYQLRLAQNVGLEVPATRITNNPESVLRFEGDTRELVYKTLTNFIFPPDKYIFTTRVRRDALSESAASVQRAPGIFQEYIPKAYELRVTVVGDKIFPTRINSQQSSATAVDWRRSQLNEGMYEIGELPQIIEGGIRAFHRAAGLVYGAYDFIVTPEGHHIFLECNPAGQWLWHEEITGQPITRAIASELLPIQMVARPAAGDDHPAA